MERFVSQQNIEQYRKLLDLSTDEPQRRMIFKLLAEEQEKFRQARETS
jgi:rubrerythrin